MAGRTDILGVGFDDVTMDEALAYCLTLLDEGKKGYIVTPNAEFVYACRRDAEARALLSGAALAVPDGVGVLYASRILRRPLKARVPGVELGERLAAALARRGGSLYLYGAKPGVAEQAAQNLQKKYPGLRVAGTQHGYEKDAGFILAQIRDSNADAVFVCTGFPRQERFMQAALEALPRGIFLGLGGSLDVYAGVAARAPVFFQKAGLEWLYRLMKEPRRIGRMSRLPLFLLLALRERIRP